MVALFPFRIFRKVYLKKFTIWKRALSSEFKNYTLNSEFVDAVACYEKIKTPFGCWNNFKIDSSFIIFAKLFFPSKNNFFNSTIFELLAGCPNLGHTTLCTYKWVYIFFIKSKFFTLLHVFFREMLYPRPGKETSRIFVRLVDVFIKFAFQPRIN